MKKTLLAGALLALAFAAQAEVCSLLAKDGTCTFATDTSGGTTIFQNPTNLSNIGSGSITPFLGTQANGIEFGVSTDTPLVNLLPLDGKRDNINTFTRTFTRNDLAFVNVAGIDYYAFFLDTNEPNGPNDFLISIDTIRLWDANSVAQQLLTRDNVTSLADVDGLFPSLIYALGPTNTLVMDGTLFAGSGLGYDLSMLIPVSQFAGVDMDSRIIFGTGFGAFSGADTGDGFEEWAYLRAVPAIPEPSTYALMLAGLGAVGFMSKRRRRAADPMLMAPA